LRGEDSLGDRQRSAVSHLYDGDIAYSDRLIGGLLTEARTSGILDEALTILLSDHGEEFWEHVPERSPYHGHSLYQELLRVPLIVRFPAKIRPGTQVKAPVSLLDIAPTVLDLAGIEVPQSHRGSSLSDSLATGREPAPRDIWAEAVNAGPDRFSLRRGNLKVIVTPHPEIRRPSATVWAFDEIATVVPALEIFDLSQDPEEQHPLGYHPAARILVEKATARATEALDFISTEPGTDSIPEELREQLRSLGYLD